MGGSTLVPVTAGLEAHMTASAIGSMIGGVSMDTLVTLLDAKLSGCYHSAAALLKEPTDAGHWVDVIVGPLLDGLIGAAVGFKVHQMRNRPVPPPKPLQPNVENGQRVQSVSTG